MTKYVETIKKWDEVAKRGDVAAIHPAGVHGTEDFFRSGVIDAIRLTELVTNLTGAFPAELSILDYGCGPGRVSFALSQYFKDVYAVDTSVYPVTNGGNLHFRTLNRKDELKGVSDVAFSISVFIHHTYADGVRMMQEVADMVKPGGYLLLQIPIYDVAREPENWTSVGVWDRESFIASAEHCGLIIIETHSNHGAFSYDKVGANHHMFQILKKP